MVVMPSPVELLSGDTNSPIVCRAPIVTIKMPAADNVTTTAGLPQVIIDFSSVIETTWTVFVRTDEMVGEHVAALKIAAIPEVQEVHHVAGEDCYVVKVRTADNRSPKVGPYMTAGGAVIPLRPLQRGASYRASVKVTGSQASSAPGAGASGAGARRAEAIS